MSDIRAWKHRFKTKPCLGRRFVLNREAVEDDPFQGLAFLSGAWYIHTDQKRYCQRCNMQVDDGKSHTLIDCYRYKLRTMGNGFNMRKL